MDGEFPIYYFPFDTFEGALVWVNSDWCSVGTLDNLIAACKAEMERRWSILDELTAEAQELGLGY